ncbi:hypothetical protein JCR33_06270 [Acuticoccus sp. 2012]|uniref:Uncharacterized protein n=2 Tax=Acuticoccus mangrovi TaxID=2796142 RepID=A0A934IPM3_9HYPH|nr:hypothetical protein [Acuticoccus mangrovi]
MRRGRSLLARMVLAASLSVGAAEGIEAAPSSRLTAQPLSEPTIELIDAELVERIRGVLESEIVVLAVENQNRRRANPPQSVIDALDAQWRAEREQTKQPLIAVTLASPTSNYLTRIQAHSLGLFTEIILMDASGLNVAQSNITSDYWQGDEAKYQRTYKVGPNAVFIDEAEFEDTTGTWRAQVNLAVKDPQSGSAIGAATFEVNLTELQRRKHAR